ncbi:COBRA-like protein 10 precursor [Tripterygium wilfordii]|uniref:COBRA-like protein 10 n=1 Tax=Tripterygium wilfordii TaxID=458696 RepID=A0A7J7C8U6_TRIWF|nr:COBRA-like protein 10 [Tripterygium wilfordii]XP_038686662.1 COBRA-like protein 10 [Tripterygium wilfordii]KAF5730574.1 COBRA-like protein 10 precursor [Tripterygium wilfordii]
MKIPRSSTDNVNNVLLLTLFIGLASFCHGQDYDEPTTPAAPPPALDNCNGIFLSYTFTSREKEFPHVKNATAQAWAFKATASILNAAQDELKGWKMFVGFQHKEILVSATGAVIVDGGDFPAAVGNGTTFAGDAMPDLKTSIDTAGDWNQIAVNIEITGTQFGIKPPGVPMPKTIKLVNDGYICPAPTKEGKTGMHVCCKRNPKFKLKPVKKTRFHPRLNGDLSMTYDVLQSYEGSYQAQVTIDNNHPLGRLDHWNLTWEWMHGEFIYDMKGAYTHKRDYSECLYGPAGKNYKDFDFSNVMNCEKRPVMSDLPADRANDTKVGKIPYCCRNGTILPTLMDESKARSIFQLRVYKMPPNLNRTALEPPHHWKIDGVLNPEYKCGPPVRVDPTEFPDPSGLQAISTAAASWQVVCNITRPKARASRCCVSFSAYYNESAVPCPTCACGCNEDTKCNPNAPAMFLPPDALLVPFANRTEKAKAWARLKHRPIPKQLPCPDNCGVSLNWHINSDYKSGWTARITLFNWADQPFEDWFAAFKLNKAVPGYENVYSFNGTKLTGNNTIIVQGLKGSNFLMGEVNGTNPDKDPRVPGKQQSVISFTKKKTPGINIARGDGFPTKVFFNGEECALPKEFPRKSAAAHQSGVQFLPALIIAIATFVLMADRFHR